MQRNCPHCGKMQVIADEDIVAPWVFTKCVSCGGLSVVRKETTGATAKAPAVPRNRAQAVLRKREPAVRAQPAEATAQTSAGPSFQRAQPQRLDGAMLASAAAEWETSSSGAAIRVPPTPPPFLRKKSEEVTESIDIGTLVKAPATRLPRLDTRPLGAILILAGLVMIGIRHYQAAISTEDLPVAIVEKAAPPPAPVPVAAEPQQVTSSMSAAVPAPVAPKAPAPLWIVKVAREGALLRSGPGREFDKLGSLGAGLRLVVRKWEKDWFQVEPENLAPGTAGIGWIRGDLIEPEHRDGGS